MIKTTRWNRAVAGGMAGPGDGCDNCVMLDEVVINAKAGTGLPTAGINLKALDFSSLAQQNLAQDFLNDINVFLKNLAQYDAEVKFRKKLNGARSSNKNTIYTSNAQVLNKSYARPNTFSNRFGPKIKGEYNIKGYGRVRVRYYNETLISGFNLTKKPKMYDQNRKSVGDAIELTHVNRIVGVLLFDSEKIRDKFFTNHYTVHKTKAYNALINNKRVVPKTYPIKQ